MKRTGKIVWTFAACAIAAAASLSGGYSRADVQPEVFEAVYLGIENYINSERADVLDPDAAVYRFLVSGEEKDFIIDCGEIYPADFTEEEKSGDPGFYEVLPAEENAYPIQNILKEGESFLITEEDGVIISCEPCKEETDNHSDPDPVKDGVPGLRTLENFLRTALMPVGSTLYVYGGGWDWQDIGSSTEARSTGISPCWNEFFLSQDENYTFYDEEDPEECTYPFGEWNQYHYKGLDCSGYAGWTVYNTIFDESLSYPGFVCSASYMAQNLALEQGLGIFEHAPAALYPGDIVSMDGHVLIIAGTCDDGSIVYIHSSPTDSRTGCGGGGVQISAISPEGQEDFSCKAYKLAGYYMEKYYPAWYERYKENLYSSEDILDFPDDVPCTGVFHWNITDTALSESGDTLTGLSDPEGIREMGAEEVLKILFEE